MRFVDLCIVDGTSHLECSCADIRRILTGYLRSSISITKVAIVLLVPFLLFFILRKYISAAIQSTLISNRSLSLLCA